MEAFVNEGCISCGQCVEICPGEFEFGDEGTAVAINDPVPADLEEGTVEAAEACPVSVIEIEE